MDLNLLTIFEAVARASSFSGAARELRLPKSSVSRAVSRLEADLGVQLLFRTTRQVSRPPPAWRCTSASRRCSASSPPRSARCPSARRSPPASCG